MVNNILQNVVKQINHTSFVVITSSRRSGVAPQKTTDAFGLPSRQLSPLRLGLSSRRRIETTTLRDCRRRCKTGINKQRNMSLPNTICQRT